MTETEFDGVRVRYDSTKSYDELLAALLTDIGGKPVPINDIATETGDWDSYRERVESHVGPSGFMLFALLDHGAWITKAGIDREAIARRARQPADRPHDAAPRRERGPVRPGRAVAHR